MSRCSGIEKFYTAKSLTRYKIQIWNDDLNKTLIIKSDNITDLKIKAETKMRRWDQLWYQKKIKEAQQLDYQGKLALATNRADKAGLLLESLTKLLDHSLSIDCTIKWDLTQEKFEIPKPNKISKPRKPRYRTISKQVTQIDGYILKKRPLKPTNPIYRLITKEPDPKDDKYRPRYGLLDIFSDRNREEVKRKYRNKFNNDKIIWQDQKLKDLEYNKNLKKDYTNNLNKYKKNLQRYEKTKRLVAINKKIKEDEEFNRKLKLTYEKKLKNYEEYLKKYLKEIANWEKKKKDFYNKQEILNKKINLHKEKYFNKEPDAIESYCGTVLSNSEYIDSFSVEFNIDYNPKNKMILVDYQLPSLESIPTLKEVKYIKSRDEFTEKHISKTVLSKLYDNILYQITLRTIHELFEADQINAIQSVNFNGYVNSIDPATGQEINSCVLSVQTDNIEFKEINLAKIDPKACFKKLKGVGSSKLHSLTPIAPILKIEREDSRFVDSYEVVDGIDEGYNLASMDWEDFENLIREVFEKAYAETGGEVKVTQASRDGGIDAVIFDPDPLRGGKIVVQAKRYTNTVGVNAVRDLYGSLMNEGANKGILVTTSDYGPDSYKFAKGKPIQLLNGSNLLHLLEQHGHKARIDIKEAKKTLSESKN